MAVEYFALLTGIMGFSVLASKLSRDFLRRNWCRSCICGWTGILHTALVLVGPFQLDHNVLAGFSAACIIWLIEQRQNAGA